MSNARFSILQARAVRDKSISDSQFRTLAALGMYTDEDGWCYPLLSTLGNDLGKSKQAVGRDTIALRKSGYLEVTARFDKNGSRRSCLYRLKFDPPRQPDVDTPSTPDVDTPSTPDVDVNVPVKRPKDIVDAILEQEKKVQEAKNSGKSWTHRDKFNFNEHILAFADKCAQRFGEPSKKNISLWVEEIGSWVDAGGRVGDWPRAVEIVSGYSQPVISITGMTKAVKFAVQERKNGIQAPREEYHPEYQIVRADPEEEKKYVPMPENLRRRRS